MIEILFSAIFDSLNNLFLMLGYVSNVNSFPQPLNSEEEQHYVEAYRNGSEEARNILIERNLRLVAHIVKKYGSCGSDSDDLISIGTIGLIKAISTFNMDKGTRLATYAARCIENAITSLRKQKVICTGTISIYIWHSEISEDCYMSSKKYKMLVRYPDSEEDNLKIKLLLGREYIKLVKGYINNLDIKIEQKKDIADNLGAKIKEDILNHRN